MIVIFDEFDYVMSQRPRKQEISKCDTEKPHYKQPLHKQSAV